MTTLYQIHKETFDDDINGIDVSSDFTVVFTDEGVTTITDTCFYDVKKLKGE